MTEAYDDSHGSPDARELADAVIDRYRGDLRRLRSEERGVSRPPAIRKSSPTSRKASSAPRPGRRVLAAPNHLLPVKVSVASAERSDHRPASRFSIRAYDTVVESSVRGDDDHHSSHRTEQVFDEHLTYLVTIR